MDRAAGLAMRGQFGAETRRLRGRTGAPILVSKRTDMYGTRESTNGKAKFAKTKKKLRHPTLPAMWEQNIRYRNGSRSRIKQVR